jgi:type IV pilus assembly protein PilM
MAAKFGFWGIDVGQSAVKAVRLELSDGQPKATAFDYIEHPKILSQPDADPEQLTREALETFLGRNSLRGDRVVIGVPGQSGLARFVKLPPVDQGKIPDIVRFEAKQQIPFPLEEVVWDYQKISEGIVTDDGLALEAEIGLFAMKREIIARYLAQFQQCGIEVHIIQISPLALCNYAIHDLVEKDKSDSEEGEDDTPAGKKRCVVVLDLGTDSSSLVINDGNKIIWQRHISIGGNHFTRALTKDMKLTFAKAEHLKRNADKSPKDLPNILKSIKPVLSDLVKEVERSLGYFTSTHRDAHIAYMVGVGNAFKLPGLQKYLSEKLSLEVRKPTQINRLIGDEVINAPVFKENLLSFPVAYGLALQGIGLGRIQTNLLPPEIRQERLIRAKKPWAVATAATLLLGAAIMAMGYGMSLQQVNAKEIDEAMAAGDSAVKTASDSDSAFKRAEAQLNETRKQVESIVAGHTERLNWIKLLAFINNCLPHELTSDEIERRKREGRSADKFALFGGAEEARRFYGENGRKALERQREIVRGIPKTENDPTPTDRPLDVKLRKHLPLVEIEAVNSLYTDNLRNAAERLREVGTEADWYNPADKERMPEGGGWIIEVRGYTYYDSGNPGVGPKSFLQRTFLANLGRESTPGDKHNDESVEEASADPIRGRLSHIMLYKYWSTTTRESLPPSFVTGSYLSELASPPSSAGDSGYDDRGSSTPSDKAPTSPKGGPISEGSFGRGGYPGSGYGSGSTWTPLGRFHSSSAGSSSFDGPGRGGFPGMPKSGPGGPPSSGNIDQVDPKAPDAINRYEFVMVFFWNEPTPSDELMQNRPSFIRPGGFGGGFRPGGGGGGFRPGGGGGGGRPKGSGFQKGSGPGGP